MNESPRFFGRRIGKSAEEVYKRWKDLGLIEIFHVKNGYGWRITDLGKSLGGKLSRNGAVPTFAFEKIKHLF